MIRKKYALMTQITDKFKMITRVFAEENPTDPQPTNNEPSGDGNGDEPSAKQQTQTQQLNYEDLISRARKEERDKLYPKIKALETDKANLTTKNNDLILKVANLEEENKQLKATGKQSESDVVKKLKADLEEANKKVKNFEENLVDENALREQIKSELEGEYEVKLYRESKVNELKDSIIPELVTGTTKEEIDNSIELSKQKFEAMKKQILGSTYVPPVNPNSSKFQQKDFNIQDLANLDPRSQEYKEMRAKLGLH